jgi:leader peptidase (prepilin peptidase)/N-methyltransferase
MSWDPGHLTVALVMAVVCAALGALAPRLVARLPEPVPDEPAAADEVDSDEAQLFTRGLPAPPPKELYVDIAARPHLAVGVAVTSALVGAAVGLSLGWTGALVYLAPLVPVGVVLLVIDWRTTLLPTRIIYPTYVGLAVLVPLAALIDQDLSSLYRAGWGWLVVGGWFWILWWLFNAWGFGDVRLSRVLGPALGFLGWSEMLMGLALMVFVGGIGGVVLSIANRDLRRRFPYGPFMLVGALLAVLVGPELARGLGY